MQPQGFLPGGSEPPMAECWPHSQPFPQEGPLSPQRCCVKWRRPGRIWQPPSILLSSTPSAGSRASSTASPSTHHQPSSPIIIRANAQLHAWPFLQLPLRNSSAEPGAGGADATTTRLQLGMLSETALLRASCLWGCPTPRAEQGSMPLTSPLCLCVRDSGPKHGACCLFA